MEKLKVHIQHVMWGFKNNKNATVTAKKVPSIICLNFWDEAW